MELSILLNKQNQNFPIEKEYLYINKFERFDIINFQRIGSVRAIANYHGNPKYSIAEAEITKDKKSYQTYGHSHFSIKGFDFIEDNASISFTLTFY